MPRKTRASKSHGRILLYGLKLRFPSQRSDSGEREGYPGRMSRSSYPASPDSERRSAARYPVEWAVDCVAEETFLYAEITDISQMGIFVACETPSEVGTLFTLRFKTEATGATFSLPGRVQWINRPGGISGSKNPGMGIVFVDLTPEDRERIVEAIHTIAYVRGITN
jgi:type IV pilus assembly protein PilZ